MKFRLPILLAAVVAAVPAYAFDSPKLSYSAWSCTFFLSAGKSVSQESSDNLTFTFGLDRRQGIGDLKVKGSYFHTKQSQDGGPRVTSENRWAAEGYYDYQLSEQYFGYVRGRLDHDGVNDLRLRRTLGIGMGYEASISETVRETGKFENSGDHEWKLSFGLNHVHRDFSEEKGSSSSLGIELGSSYRRQLTETIFLKHDIGFVPSVEDFETFFLVSDLNAGITVSESWEVQFAWLYDYDGGAAPGTKKSTYKFALGVGYRF